MIIDSRSSTGFTSAYFTKTSRISKAWVAVASMLISCTLLGSMLSMFEMQSESARLVWQEQTTAPAHARLATKDEPFRSIR